MSNPYAAPGSDGEVTAGAARVSKPIRIWVFQALLLFQLVAGGAATFEVLQQPEVRALPLSYLLRALIRPILTTPVIVMLLLALQRLGPRPRVVAPVLAAVWWLLSITSYLAYGVWRDPEASSSVPSPWGVGLAVHAGLLYFVLSTWLHRRTRAYLDPPKP
jgi:hypothetical protein